MISSTAESYIKHTPAGEMPDTHRLSILRKRMIAAAPIIREKIQARKNFVPFLLGIITVTATLLIFRGLNRKKFPPSLT